MIKPMPKKSANDMFAIPRLVMQIFCKLIYIKEDAGRMAMLGVIVYNTIFPTLPKKTDSQQESTNG
jgi:hypothetical protein